MERYICKTTRKLFISVTDAKNLALIFDNIDIISVVMQNNYDPFRMTTPDEQMAIKCDTKKICRRGFPLICVIWKILMSHGQKADLTQTLAFRERPG